MHNAIKTILFPELFIGFVAPVGTDISSTLKSFKNFFNSEGYKVVTLKVTDYFGNIDRSIKSKVKLKNAHEDERIKSYIEFGNDVRRQFKDDSVLAAYTIFRIMRERIKLGRRSPEFAFNKTVYLIHQFKRKEEVDLFRSVYGKLFF
ncbi:MULTISPECIES: hypothetical protein [unclassified Aureimonas]|uniref:hypothetical protein n=1 Tax=unclassified Aureimonas TaxID=2615206 RepID=UPI000A63CC06|nr:MULTISPECIES: hypothetical protein [unclassified Aureimonas]